MGVLQSIAETTSQIEIRRLIRQATSIDELTSSPTKNQQCATPTQTVSKGATDVTFKALMDDKFSHDMKSANTRDREECFVHFVGQFPKDMSRENALEMLDHLEDDIIGRSQIKRLHEKSIEDGSDWSMLMPSINKCIDAIVKSEEEYDWTNFHKYFAKLWAFAQLGKGDFYWKI